MNHDDRFWDRKALYEEVWSTPMRTLAEKYGISDVALAKNCRKLSIPLPGRGYWARLSAGQSITKTPLPAISHEIRLKKPLLQKRNPSPQPVGSELERGQIERLEHSKDEFVLKRSALSHPLITQARTVLRESREDDRKILQCRKQCLDIRVSEGSLDRALRIMAGLISLIEAEGFSLSVGDGLREHTAAKIHGQEIRFGILEKVDRIDAISLPSDNILKKVLSYGGKEVLFKPSGKLSIEIWRPWAAARKRWKDRSEVSLEAMLPQIVGSFIQTALEEREREEKRLAGQREEERRKEERAKLQLAIRQEKAKIRALHRAALNSIRAAQIRHLISAARDSAVENGQPVRAGTSFGDWLIWAERQADRIDPLKENPISILDRLDECRPKYDSFYGYRDVEPRVDFPKPLWRVK